MKKVEVRICVRHSRFNKNEEGWTQVVPKAEVFTDIVGVFNRLPNIEYSFKPRPCDLCGVAK